MTKQTQEALKMAYDWLNEYAPPEVVQACEEALESQNIYKLALENILHGSLLDKHNRNDNGMIDAKRWSDTERHLDTWIKTAKAALDE